MVSCCSHSFPWDWGCEESGASFGITESSAWAGAVLGLSCSSAGISELDPEEKAESSSCSLLSCVGTRVQAVIRR